MHPENDRNSMTDDTNIEIGLLHLNDAHQLARRVRVAQHALLVQRAQRLV